MASTPLVIGAAERAALAALRDLAAKHPVDMPSLMQRLASPEGKRAHMDQMNSQSIELPFGFLVTFSIETGHPIGAARHMSMSSPVPTRTPTPEAIWMVAQELGFVGSLKQCDAVYPEELLRGSEERQVAVNVIQRLAMTEGGRP